MLHWIIWAWCRGATILCFLVLAAFRSAWRLCVPAASMPRALSPEFGQQVLGEGYRVLLDFGKENVQFQSSGLVVSRSLMKNNPQLVENVAKATIEGVAFIHKPANKEIVLKSLGRNLRLSKPDQMEKAYQGLLAALPKKPCPSMEGMNAVIKFMAQHGINAKAAQLKAEEQLDLSFCKRFEDSGFFKSLY